MRLPLSISTNYVPDWGVQEALREACSNFLDADEETALAAVETARFAGMEGGSERRGTVTYSRSDGGTVRFENPGADMTRDALLMGESTKRGNEAARGQFGEGSKLLVLALLRAGKQVRIETQSEIWTPSLGEHEAFPGRLVVVFNIRQRPKRGDGVVVEVSGIEPEDYERMRSSFLYFNPPKLTATDDYNGTVIFDPDHKGKIFVKGVLVQVDPNLAYGYDLKGVKVDRDRKMVNKWDAQYAMSSILVAARKQSDKVDVLELMEAGAPEFADAQYQSSVGAAALEGFKKKYGEDCYPCASMAEAQELGHSGVKAVPVPRILLEALRGQGLDANRAKDENLKAPSRVWALQDLTVPERASLQWGVHMIAAALNVEPEQVLTRLRVVDFKAPVLLGLHRGADICVSRTLLADRFELLAVLVHEWAHDAGSDAEVGHVRSMERLWTNLTRKIAGGEL